MNLDEIGIEVIGGKRLLQHQRGRRIERFIACAAKIVMGRGTGGIRRTVLEVVVVHLLLIRQATLTEVDEERALGLIANLQLMVFIVGKGVRGCRIRSARCLVARLVAAGPAIEALGRAVVGIGRAGHRVEQHLGHQHCRIVMLLQIPLGVVVDAAHVHVGVGLQSQTVGAEVVVREAVEHHALHIGIGRLALHTLPMVQHTARQVLNAAVAQLLLGDDQVSGRVQVVARVVMQDVLEVLGASVGVKHRYQAHLRRAHVVGQRRGRIGDAVEAHLAHG